MRRYKLYLDGVWYKDADGTNRCFKYTTSRNSKTAAVTYQRDATITDLHDRVVSKAKLSPNGCDAYNVCFDKNELIGGLNNE